MMNDDEQQKLTVMMVELSSKIQILLDKQDELAENINYGKLRMPVFCGLWGDRSPASWLKLRGQHYFRS